MTGDERWTRVVVDVAAADAELAADVLWGFGPAAIEEQAGTSSVRLLAGFADTTSARAAATTLADRRLGPAEVVPVDDDGLDGWRAWARPVAAGPFLVVPAWLAEDDLAVPAGGQVLLVDPGRTFGSGSHPTTRLVLARAAALVRPGHAVLDVGCGSGILAVAAALAGAERVLGIDIDPGSPAATAANARANGVADRVAASTAPLAEVAEAAGRGDGGGRFDLVLANLLAPVVAELAGDLAAVVAPGGHLVVSGLLADRWEQAAAHLVAADRRDGPLEVVAVDEDEGWVAVTLAG